MRTRLSDLWSRLVRFRSAASQVLLLSLALQLSALLAPIYIQTVVDEALPSGDDSLLSLLLIGFGLVYVLQAVVRALREWVIVALGQSLSFDLAEHLLFGAAFLLCVHLGALAVLDKRLTVGVLLAFLSYRASFAASATALVKQFASWRLLSLHLDRLSDIVGEQRESFAPHVRRQVLAGPAIRFDHVTFAYSPGEQPILDDIDLEIASGSFVAITGRVAAPCPRLAEPL